jgi:hypothetical protein
MPTESEDPHEQSQEPGDQPAVARTLSPMELEALRLYSQRDITSTEVKACLGVDRRGLIDLMAKQGLRLPRIPREHALDQVSAAFPALGQSAAPGRAPRG